MNGDDDIAVIDQQEDVDNLGYPVNVTDDFQSNSTLQLYVGTGKPENDASLHALRNAYHDLKLRYNEQTSKVHSMRQAIKDMEAQRIQNTNRPFSLNTTAAFAGAAGAGTGNPTASGAVEANPHLRASLGYADSLQRQILRLKNTSAVREKDMERKYSDLYTKYKRQEADVNTLQLRNRKTTVELEKTSKLLKDREMLIEQLTNRNDVLEKMVSSQNPESFSEEIRLQEKHLMGIMEYQTKYIDELKDKVQEQNSIINKQLEMIRTFSRNQKEAEAAALRQGRPDGDSLFPYTEEQQDAGARPRQSGALTISAQTQPVQATRSSPPSVSRQQHVPIQQETTFGRESLADVEIRRKNDMTLHTNFADNRSTKLADVNQASSQLPVPPNSHDTPDSPILRRSPNLSSPKVPQNPSDSSYSMARYLDTESRQSRLQLEDVSTLPDTMYKMQPSSTGRQVPIYENEQRLHALRIDDKKLDFSDTIYRPATQKPYTRQEDGRTGHLYPPLSQENNYENITVFLPPTQQQAEGDYANVSELMTHRSPSNVTEAQICPVCNKNFPANPIDDFQQHVLDCMDGGEEEGTSTLQNISQKENGRECPMCSAVFPGGLPQEEFERHVQEHFGEDPMMERFEVLQA
ncbi:tax1-binding protein 1 homolog [Pecten maximus]|uniref:tax1-binding protein 1 homolog n=1 Tax=Pecten maximus TaxID=6579 RepID=UPI0014586052|nr:tax1-binding protein 1 homolog [Pecten maximus]XP_033732997.1 tax1-binding protein 1 homolog [Pecten maximus]XP_033732998.1 tax1-binding protein 1 homolog [Pecten maximus]